MVGPSPSTTLAPYLTGQHEFTILSAEDPNGQTLSPIENSARTVESLKELRTAGYTPHILENVADGKHGNVSVFVPDMSTRDALAFQDHMKNKYGHDAQSSVITKQGLVDVATRTTTPMDFSRTQFGVEAESQPHHSIAEGGGERLPFALQPTDKSIPVKEPFSGTHFSQNPIEGGVLSGNRRGVSGAGAESQRLTAGPGAPGGVYVYPEGTRPEPQIVSRKHESRIQGEKAIADVATNPTWKAAYESAKQEAVSQGVEPKQAAQAAINVAEHALKSAGWDGYKNSAMPNTGAFLFGDQPVTKLGEPPAPSPELVPHPNLPPKPVEQAQVSPQTPTTGAAPRKPSKAPSKKAASPPATQKPVPVEVHLKVSQEPASSSNGGKSGKKSVRLKPNLTR